MSFRVYYTIWYVFFSRDRTLCVLFEGWRLFVFLCCLFQRSPSCYFFVVSVWRGNVLFCGRYIFLAFESLLLQIVAFNHRSLRHYINSMNILDCWFCSWEKTATIATPTKRKAWCTWRIATCWRRPQSERSSFTERTAMTTWWNVDTAGHKHFRWF